MVQDIQHARGWTAAKYCANCINSFLPSEMSHTIYIQLCQHKPHESVDKPRGCGEALSIKEGGVRPDSDQ